MASLSNLVWYSNHFPEELKESNKVAWNRSSNRWFEAFRQERGHSLLQSWSLNYAAHETPPLVSPLTSDGLDPVSLPVECTFYHPSHQSPMQKSYEVHTCQPAVSDFHRPQVNFLLCTRANHASSDASDDLLGACRQARTNDMQTPDPTCAFLWA